MAPEAYCRALEVSLDHAGRLRQAVRKFEEACREASRAELVLVYCDHGGRAWASGALWDSHGVTLAGPCVTHAGPWAFSLEDMPFCTGDFPRQCLEATSLERAVGRMLACAGDVRVLDVALLHRSEYLCLMDAAPVARRVTGPAWQAMKRELLSQTRDPLHGAVACD